MLKKKYKMAICYDFDGTLSPGNMQEYGFFYGLGDLAKHFWKESTQIAKENNADPILAYMKHMIDKAAESRIPTTKKAFHDYGKTVKFYNGVDTWFERINEYGKQHNISIEHYIVSSGLKEMIEGTKIKKEFKKIYACSFIYDHNSVAKWPAVAVNYTTKTQFLFRINKGINDDSDNKKINDFIPEKDRPVPFKRMVYIGDGATDIPCMKLVKDKGGFSIAVYPNTPPKKRTEANRLIKDGRVHYSIEADYSADGHMESLIKAIIRKVVSDLDLNELGSMKKTTGKKNGDHEGAHVGKNSSTFNF